MPAKKTGGGGGALPHKSVATDSKPLSKPAAQASRPRRSGGAGFSPPADAPAERRRR